MIDVDKKSMFLGAGLGVIIVTFVFFIALQFAAKPEVEIQTVSEPMSNEQVIEQARKLGMVMVKELPSTSDTSASNQSDDKKRINELENKTLELHSLLAMVDEQLRASNEALEEANKQLQRSGNEGVQAENRPAGATSPTSGIAQTANIQSANAATTNRPSTNVPTANESTANTPSTTAQTPTPSAAPSTNVGESSHSVGTAADMGDFTRIVISAGENSISISSLLSNSGVVDDAANFNAYVMENGKSTVLIAGTYDIPKDATYDEVLEIITTVIVDEP